MDSEAESSVSSLEPTSCGFHPAELRGRILLILLEEQIINNTKSAFCYIGKH